MCDDPLLARLPIAAIGEVRVGHALAFDRSVAVSSLHPLDPLGGDKATAGPRHRDLDLCAKDPVALGDGFVRLAPSGLATTVNVGAAELPNDALAAVSSADTRFVHRPEQRRSAVRVGTVLAPCGAARSAPALGGRAVHLREDARPTVQRWLLDHRPLGRVLRQGHPSNGPECHADQQHRRICDMVCSHAGSLRAVIVCPDQSASRLPDSLDDDYSTIVSTGRPAVKRGRPIML